MRRGFMECFFSVWWQRRNRSNRRWLPLIALPCASRRRREKVSLWFTVKRTTGGFFGGFGVLGAFAAFVDFAGFAAVFADVPATAPAAAAGAATAPGADGGFTP